MERGSQKSRLLSTGTSYFCPAGCEGLCCIPEPLSSRAMQMGPLAREALSCHHERRPQP